jgi:hypothetical protein
MLLFSDLLKKHGLGLESSFKLVRHKLDEQFLEKLMDNDAFEDYHCLNGKERFECDYVIAFIAKESTKALFWGVYKNNGKIAANKANIAEHKKLILNYDFDKVFYYNLEKMNAFNYLEQRVIIDWGGSTRNWVQNNPEKEIVEIKPKGFVSEFSGYLDFVLSFRKLEQIVHNADANYTWRNKLSSISGIYLILDKITGKQYIGSAYGEKGVWGRWESYVKTGSGGNNLLVELLANNENYKYNFQFTLLQTLPSNLRSDEVIGYEKLYKEKLGSRVFGLNKN